jgi:hypothetical protein
MALKLPDSLCSPKDLRAVIIDVRAYAKWYAQEAIKQRVTAGKGPIASPPTVSEEATRVLVAWADGGTLDAAAIEGLIKALENLDRTAPRLTITLAAPPAGDVRRSLVGWCRQNLSPDMLVSFRFNRSLLGGMVVRSGSRIYDWSFCRSILANKDAFPEVLRNV